MGEGNESVTSKGNVWGDGGAMTTLCSVGRFCLCVCVCFIHFTIPGVLNYAISVLLLPVQLTPFPLSGTWSAGS